MASFRCALCLMVAVGAGCAAKGDTLGGTGGGGAGTGGAGGTSQSGGTNGSGGATGVDGGVDYQGMLTAAEATWAAAKSGCPAYHYQSRTTSVFGFCAITTVEISKDEPIGRAFISGDSGGCPPDPNDAATVQWNEVGAAEVGSHSQGDPPSTVEQMFASCQSILGADPSMYGIYLRFGTDGVPTMCTETLTQCVDDCTDGLNISSFACDAPDGVDAGHD